MLFRDHAHIYLNTAQCFAAIAGECRRNVIINGSIDTKKVKKFFLKSADILKVSTKYQQMFKVKANLSWAFQNYKNKVVYLETDYYKVLLLIDAEVHCFSSLDGKKVL